MKYWLNIWRASQSGRPYLLGEALFLMWLWGKRNANESDQNSPWVESWRYADLYYGVEADYDADPF